MIVPNVKWLILALTALAVLGYSLAWVSNRQASETREVGLVADPASLSFGTVWETGDHVATIRIENRDRSRVVVESFGTSCSCLSLEPKSFALEPGGRIDLKAHIDLRLQPQQSEEVRVRIAPKLTEKSATAPAWLLRGTVRRILTAEATWHLGRYGVLTDPAPVWTLPVKAARDLKALHATSTLPGFDVAVVPGSANYEYAVKLSCTSQPVPGELTGVVNLQPVARDGEWLPLRSIPVAGRFVPDIRSEPEIVQVSSRPIGEAFEESVALRSLTNRPFAVRGVRAVGEGLTVTPQAEGRFLVRQKASVAGFQSNRIVVEVTVAGHDNILTIPVEYTGVKQ